MLYWTDLMFNLLLTIPRFTSPKTVNGLYPLMMLQEIYIGMSEHFRNAFYNKSESVSLVKCKLQFTFSIRLLTKVLI